MEIAAVRQDNGDLRIDDVSEDAPLLKLEFFDVWAKVLSAHEKDMILAAACRELTEILAQHKRDAGQEHLLIHRREAVMATRKKRTE